MGAEGSMVDREVVLLWNESDRSVSTAKLILRSTGLPTPPVTHTHRHAWLTTHSPVTCISTIGEKNGAGDGDGTRTHQHTRLNTHSPDDCISTIREKMVLEMAMAHEHTSIHDLTTHTVQTTASAQSKKNMFKVAAKISLFFKRFGCLTFEK